MNKFKLLEFNPYDDIPAKISNDNFNPNEDHKEFIVQMFALNELGESASIFVEGFEPFFYVKVGEDWLEKDKIQFINHLKGKMGRYYDASITSSKLVEYKNLYLFDAGKLHKFIRIKFKNMPALNKAKKLWFTDTVTEEDGFVRTLTDGGYKFNNIAITIYEANIPPLLRLFHVKEISPSGWVGIPDTIKSVKTSVRRTTCKYEYYINYKKLLALPKKETQVPYKMCSFDIEASSSHGDFPLPIKNYKKLAENMIDIWMFSHMKFDNPPEKNESLLRDIIFAAFCNKIRNQPEDFTESLKYLKNEVSLVYSKSETINFDELDNIFNNWINIIPAEKNLKDKATADYIDNIEAQQDEMHDEQDIDTDTNGDVDTNGDSPDGCCDKIEETGVDQIFYRKKQYVKKYKNKEATIIDLLNDDKCGRDTKLLEITNSLTSLFPALEGDKVTYIGSTFKKYGQKSSVPYLNHCIVLRGCEMPKNIENCVIESYNTEKEVLLAWTALIQREDPDIVLGYNIDGFDYNFMDKRSQELDCRREFLVLSRNKKHVCLNRDWRTGKENIESGSIIIASGQHNTNFIKMTGRLQIDLFNYFRRNYQLASYKLDNVSPHFIGDKVSEITHNQDKNTTIIKSKNLTGLEAGSFIKFEETTYSVEYYKKGKKFEVIEINEEDNTYEIAGQEFPNMETKVRWCLAKDDVTPKEIFSMWNGSDKDRAIIAKYCLQDCNILHHLMQKIDIITEFDEMSNLCSVPKSYLVSRGQGIKLTSYIAKKCREKKTLIPVIQKSLDDEGYEGAIVLEPKCDIYLDDPVACVDYSSLYPSSMISENLSHDSKVWSKEYDLEDNLLNETGYKDESGNYIYDNLPEYKYVDVTYDTYKWMRKTVKAAATKEKVGYKICRFAQFPEGKAILPSVLEELLAARKATRKQIPEQKDDFMKNILDKRQASIKVTANSLYGGTGAKTSTFFEKDVAASCTATGRKLLIYGKNVIEEAYKDRIVDLKSGEQVRVDAEYVYGDSVANYTPIFIRYKNIECKNIIKLCPIDSILEFINPDNPDNPDNPWISCKEIGKEDKEVLELTNYNIETWTEKGWTKLYRVIRHKLAPHKKMMRVLTHTGVIDVTDDHSLLTLDANCISPKDIEIGTELLHHDLPETDITSNDISEEEARIMGFFFGDGSCGVYNCISGKKCSWALNNSSMEIIKQYQNLCKKVYNELDWNILDTISSSGVYKLVPNCNKKYGKLVEFINIYRNKSYHKNCKIIPEIIMHSNKNIREAFWDGLYDADGDKSIYNRIDQKNQISSAYINWLACSLGYRTSINTRSDKQDIYSITLTKKTQRKNLVAVKKIIDIQYNDYVYDLTTENHHFAAGVGKIIAHNTDSIFFKFNIKNPEKEPTDSEYAIKGKKALEITIELAQEAGALASKFLKKPHDLEYEKTFMPFGLLSKKRYFGILYENDANKGSFKYMGLVLKRRDNADIVKDIYGGAVQIIMKERNIAAAVKYVKTELKNMIEEKYPLDKLIVTKALRSFYANPQQIAHKVLAERMGRRDPGNKPSVGDRIPYAYVKIDNKKALQGEKIEHPTYITDNKLELDYPHYITNQIMKPLQQVFALVLEQISDFKIKKGHTLSAWQRQLDILKEKYPEPEKYRKKLEELRCKEVKILIFDEFIKASK
jgi:DNA polymerase elongation subunit (family B)